MPSGPPDWTSSPPPPPCLWVRGTVGLGDLARSVAVVGARASTAYGDHVAGELGSGLARRGFLVVSGLAYGIDGTAHRAALGTGTSLAVVAGGVDRAYPRGHDALMGELVRRGAVVSEVPPGSAPTRSRFLQRNRLIAALTGGTVVVEAAVRSGALSTARAAAALGRPVAAVPGPVTSSSSAGCHVLVREGRAVLVTDAAEVADLVGRIGADAADPEAGQPESVRRAGRGRATCGRRSAAAARADRWTGCAWSAASTRRRCRWPSVVSSCSVLPSDTLTGGAG